MEYVEGEMDEGEEGAVWVYEEYKEGVTGGENRFITAYCMGIIKEKWIIKMININQGR